MPEASPARSEASAERSPLSGRHSALEVLLVFLRLGLTSFGGPVAHLGYFRSEFVERRKWLDEASYVDIVALCQFLPGPASSQVGFAVGMLRAGLKGAFSAWLGFTLPSAVALILFGYGVTQFGDLAHAPWLHGLKIVAVAVVAQAVWGMSRSLAPDRERASIAVGAAILSLAVPSAAGQIGAIVIGGLIGRALRSGEAQQPGAPLVLGLPRSLSIGALILFFLLLFRLDIRSAGKATTFEVDHVVAGTGFRIDIARLGFLAPAIASGLALTENAPKLSANFESSVPGLYFAGTMAAYEFGPLLRFVCGAEFTARRIARHLAKAAKAVAGETEEFQPLELGQELGQGRRHPSPSA